jgi:hypothetical protein
MIFIVDETDDGVALSDYHRKCGDALRRVVLVNTCIILDEDDISQ